MHFCHTIVYFLTPWFWIYSHETYIISFNDTSRKQHDEIFFRSSFKTKWKQNKSESNPPALCVCSFPMHFFPSIMRARRHFDSQESFAHRTHPIDLRVHKHIDSGLFVVIRGGAGYRCPASKVVALGEIAVPFNVSMERVMIWRACVT